MTPHKPQIGDVVIYRSRTNDYDVPAIVNCTAETLSQAGVEAGHVPPLSGDGNVHLTVLSPGKPGMRRAAGNFVVESPHGRSENVAGTYQEWDIAPAVVVRGYPLPQPATWRWPERAAADAEGAESEAKSEAKGEAKSEARWALSAEQLAEFAFFTTGAATGPLLRDNPGYVFPSEEVSQLVRECLQSRFGFDVAELEGYWLGGFGFDVAELEGYWLGQARQTQPEGGAQ